MPHGPTPSHATLAPPALRALLGEIVDYAGLFPPADLALDEALHRYARYRQAAEAWMLARFVIPAGRLGALAPYGGLFAEAPPFGFSVLGTGGADAAAFHTALQADLEAVAAFQARHPGQVQVDALEVRLPKALHGARPAVLQRFMEEVADDLGAAGRPDLEIFFEVPVAEEVERLVLPVVEALVACRPGPGRLGMKVRTGGLEPAAFPAPPHVACFLAACRRAGVRFKATAGLHHPVRHYAPSVGARMYGFFNIFGAAVLGAAHDLDADALRPILEEEDAGSFHVAPDAFAWRDLTASPDLIRRVRQDHAVSFGSCSFDEPRDDLRQLGLLG